MKKTHVVECPECKEMSIWVGDAFGIVQCRSCDVTYRHEVTGKLNRCDAKGWVTEQVYIEEGLPTVIPEENLPVGVRMALLWVQGASMPSIAETFSVSVSRVRNALGGALIMWATKGLITLPTIETILEFVGSAVTKEDEQCAT